MKPNPKLSWNIPDLDSASDWEDVPVDEDDDADNAEDTSCGSRSYGYFDNLDDEDAPKVVEIVVPSSEKDTWEKASELTDSLGLSLEEAINVFVHQLVINNGFPFRISADPQLPPW